MAIFKYSRDAQNAPLATAEQKKHARIGIRYRTGENIRKRSREGTTASLSGLIRGMSSFAIWLTIEAGREKKPF